LNGITWGSRLRLADSVVGNNSKVVVFSICQLICTALVDVSDYFGVVPPGVGALHLHLDDISLNCTATIIEGLVPSEINECSVPVVGLRPSWSFRYISLIPSNEGFVQWSRIRLANGVDSHDPHQVFLSMHKTSDSAFDFCGNLCLDPRATAEIHLLHQVVCDGGATIVGRGTPGKFTAGCCHSRELQGSFRWSRTVKHSDICSCLSTAKLIGNLKLVDTCIIPLGEGNVQDGLPPLYHDIKVVIAVHNLVVDLPGYFGLGCSLNWDGVIDPLSSNDNHVLHCRVINFRFDISSLSNNWV